MRSIRDPLLRQLYRGAYHVLHVYALLFHRPSRGVKCLLTNAGEVLLVRHTYGPRGRWHLPGGGVRRNESMFAAGEREMREELGLHDLALRELGTVEVSFDRRRVGLGCMYAELPDRTLETDPVEIAEARWFAPDQLPRHVGEEVEALVAMLADSGDSSGAEPGSGSGQPPRPASSVESRALIGKTGATKGSRAPTTEE